MLILVIGEAGSGKTFFTEQKLYPYVGARSVEVIRDPTPGRLKALDIAGKFRQQSLDDSVLVIEAVTDKDIPHELRTQADYLVFMSPCALESYFGRLVNDVDSLRRESRVFAAMKAICGVNHTPVIFDPNGKRFIAHYD